MCGLVGGTLFNAQTITEACAAIAHRGRDASNRTCYPERGLWFGHNRLAIQGIGAAADQPFERGDISVVFNGELWRRTWDGYGHLRAGRARTDSDTELLAMIYEECGDDLPEFCRRLDGMFAFAIWDRGRGELIIARDWLGRIPLYWLRRGAGLAFASEAKALTGPLAAAWEGAGGRRRTAEGRVALFPAGHVARYRPADGRLEIARFRDWQGYAALPDADDRGLAYYADGLRERLAAAVRNEAIADVPVCTILSGGIDSTIITALLKEVVPDLVAYTVSAGESDGKDDLAWSRVAAEVVGVPLREVIVPPADVLPALEETVWAVEDARWVQVAPAVPQIALARCIGADGYKVVFGGEGADELFGSYGDVRRWAWRPEQYHPRRVELCERLHDNNLIRGNKAMMWGGTVELRTPFLDREVVDWCLRIPTCYRADGGGKGRHMKFALRSAFAGLIPEVLLWRPKVTFQEGAHTAFLKDWKAVAKEMFVRLFG